MKKTVMVILGLLIAHIAATAANFIFLFDTETVAEFKWLSFVITLCYIGVWGWFIAKGRCPVVGTVTFSAMFVVSVAGFIVSNNGLLADWLIPFAIMLWTPFVGLGAVIRSDAYVWLAAAVVSAAMTAFSVARIKRLKAEN